VIEIGVFEGSTTFWMADQLTPHNPDLKIYAVDPHVGSNDMTEDFNLVQENFEHNLNMCQHKNVTYIRKYSQDGLIDLINQGVQAELIYVDGDHKAGEVLTDLVLSWKLLKVGGIMLCDDTTTWRYTDSNGTESAQMSVRMAVEMFIQCNWHKVRILQIPDSTQTAFMKIKE
jgi:predicted O-methyltransferase YrrM